MNEQPQAEQVALPLPTEAEFKQLVAQANNGDTAALATLRGLLDNHPAIWKRVGDLAAQSETLLIGLITVGNTLAAESLRRTIRDMKSQLLGPTPSILEKLAIDRVVATWLVLQHVDAEVNGSHRGTLSNANYQLKRQDLANKRYLSAIKSLTDLRRLLPQAADTAIPEATPTLLRIFAGEPEVPSAASA